MPPKAEDVDATEANRSACPQECFYAGCHNEEFTIPSFCDEETGKCYHGDQDERCKGLYDGEQYPGMEDTEDGRPTFCRFAKGVPVKTAECPAPGVFPDTTADSASARSFVTGTCLVVWTLMGAFLYEAL